VRSLKIAVPNKGRLQRPVLDLLYAVGIRPLASDDRALIIPTSWEGVQLVMVRTEDIPNIVEAGAAELGITGLDYVVESGASVEELVKLDFGRAKIVLALPINWNVEDPSKLDREIRIATKYVNIATDYLRRKGVKAKLVKISGAAEVMPSLNAADGIIDVTNTGTTLRLHGLNPIDDVMETYAVVIGNKNWMKSEDADKVNMVLTMIKGTITARGKKLLLMNVPDRNLDNVISSLPAMLAPAVTRLSRGDVWEVITVADEKELPEVVALLKGRGAKDILVVDIEKVIR
jgi:ATP phosphoribosyltransferase